MGSKPCTKTEPGTAKKREAETFERKQRAGSCPTGTPAVSVSRALGGHAIPEGGIQPALLMMAMI